MGMYQKPKKAVGGRARSEKRDALFRLALTQTPLFPNKIKKAGEFFPAFSSGNEFFSRVPYWLSAFQAASLRRAATNLFMRLQASYISSVRPAKDSRT